MAITVQDVLSGKLTVSDVIKWLNLNSSELPECVELNSKSAFVADFLNYIRENCSWLLVNYEHASGTAEEHGSKTRPADASKENEHLSHDLFDTSSVKACGNCVHINLDYSELKMKRNQRSKDITSEVNFVFRDAKKASASKNKAQFSSNRSQPRVKNASVDVLNNDSFPPLATNIKHNSSTVQKRITPTPVNSMNNSKSGHSFSFPNQKSPDNIFRSAPMQDIRNFSLKTEREILKETRDKLSKGKPSSKPLVVSSNKQSLTNELQSRNCCVPNVQLNLDQTSRAILYITPSLNQVTSKCELSMLVEIYDFVFNNGLVPNVTAELYFIFQLITSKVPEGKQPPNVNSIFISVHNCIYFAVSLLIKQRDVLNILDNSTLTTLMEIPYLPHFSTELIDHIKCCLNMQEMKTKPPCFNIVPYRADYDGGDSFPDQASFHSFKKQRDMFYAMLREWQQQNLTADAKLSQKFSTKVIQLITLGSNAANHYHLARLIQSQMIASCLCFEVDDDYDELLSDIKHNSPQKFKKLEERFLTPSGTGGPSPAPTFPGIQLFFYEFLQAASCSYLNQYLNDIFTGELFNLYDSIQALDLDSSSISVKEQFTFVLHKLRLLGKFLGLLHFLPYKVSKPTPKNILKTQLALRERTAPVMNFPELLQGAIRENKLILIIPWVIEYMSMMDPISLQLKRNQESFRILTVIYRGNVYKSLDKQTITFLRLLIGWLFDVHHYPGDLYRFFEPIQNLVGQHEIKVGLDCLHLINKQLVYSCCPYLVEFKILIHNYLNGIKNKTQEIRKIKPVTASKDNSSSALLSHQIETNLEENFFVLHPLSVKNTIQFVAERIASRMISKIRLQITKLKFNVVEGIIQDASFKSLCELKDKERVPKICNLVDKAVLHSYEATKMDVEECCYQEIKNILPQVLSVETKQTVLDTCCKISFRNAMNKVIEWCDSNLISDEIKKDITQKVQKETKKLNTPETQKVGNNEFITICLVQFRMIHNNVQRKSEFPKEDIAKICPETITNIKMMQIDAITLKTLAMMTVDLYLSLLINFPKTHYEVEEYFIELWESMPKGMINPRLFLCPKNIHLLQVSSCSEINWRNYIHLLSQCLHINIFSDKALEVYMKVCRDSTEIKIPPDFWDTLFIMISHHNSI